MRLSTLLEARTWYVNSDVSFWSFTQELERFAAKMKDVIARGDRGAEATKFADLLLQAIELWKAGCVEEQTGWAVENQPEEIWDAFRDAIAFMAASDDTNALKAIMRLTGFGASVDVIARQQPAKRASAVLRMFNPKEWGVVDWRTGYMLWALQEKKWNVPQAITLAKSASRQSAEAQWKMINEVLAIHLNKMYREQRTASLPNAADVEMAVFGLSFEVWSANIAIRNKHHQTYVSTLRGTLHALDNQL
jgi:hypothetical protein